MKEFKSIANISGEPVRMNVYLKSAMKLSSTLLTKVKYGGVFLNGKKLLLNGLERTTAIKLKLVQVTLLVQKALDSLPNVVQTLLKLVSVVALFVLQEKLRVSAEVKQLPL